MRYSSTIDDPRAFIDAALADFGLDSPSRHGSTVGGAAVNILAENIHDRASVFEGPDGRWQANAESTIKQKGQNSPNVDTGEMLALEQIKGEVSVGKREAEMTYGKDEENKKKAHFAHEGQSHLKIKRPFMGVTDADADEIASGVADDLVAHIMNFGTRP